MSRPSNNQNSGAPAFTTEELLDIILADVLATQTMSTEDWWALNKNAPFTSMAIPAGRSREYHVTQVAVNAAHDLTQQSWDAREDLRQTVDRTAFDRASFTAIGETIANCRAHMSHDDAKDPEGRVFFAALAKDYADNLSRLAGEARINVDRHIPCQLFDLDQGVGPFAIGPVTFRPRDQWISAFIAKPPVLATVQDVEARRLSIEGLRTRAFAKGGAADDFDAWEVVDFLRGFGWVATIRIADHERERSQQKASIVIGLAIEALGLRFHAEDARRFTKADRAYLAGEIRFATLPSGGILRGSRVHRSGLGGAPGRLTAKLAAETPFLDTAGAILEAYVAGRQTGRAPNLVERWTNALYWFGEARREMSDFMAVVNYGCALDGLSGAGGNIKPMIAFAEAALAPRGGASAAGGISVADAVRRVYAEGRNKLAHGETPGLLEDLSDVRRLGDDLLSKLFDPVSSDLAAMIITSPAKLAIPEAHAIRGQIARMAARP